MTGTTLDGRVVTTEAMTTSGLGVGQETEVLYHPEDPSSAMPASDSGGGESRCELQLPDGSSEYVDCPPGMFGSGE